MLIMIFLITVALATLMAWFNFGPSARGGKRLPSPLLGGLPGIFGRFSGHSLVLALPGVLQRVEGWASGYGRPYYLSVMAQNWVVVKDEKEMKRMLNLRPSVFVRAPTALGEVVETIKIGPFLFSSEGEEWARFRRLTAPAFNVRNVERGLPSVHRVAKRLVGRWAEAADDGAVVKALPDLHRAMFNVIALVGFGLDTRSIGPKRSAAADPSGDGANGDVDIFAAMDDVLKVADLLLFMPWGRLMWDHMPWLPWVRRYKRRQEAADKLVRAFIAEERAVQAAEAANGSGGAAETVGNCRAEGVLLRNMISALDAAGNDATAAQLRRAKLTDTEVLYNFKGFFVAGTDTTGITLAWCMFHLAANSRVQQLAREEVDKAPLTAAVPTPEGEAAGGAGASGRFGSLDRLKALRYCEAVVWEVLRLHTPAPIIGLSNIKEATVCGETYEPGWNFWLAGRMMGRTGENFSFPMLFLPERWLSPEERSAALDSMSAGSGGGGVADLPFNHRPEALLTFGHGPRVCPGKALALAETVLFVATVLESLELSLAPNHGPPGEVTDFTTAPGKVDLVMKRRSAAGPP